MAEPDGYISVEQVGTLRVRRVVLWLFTGVLLAAFPIYTEVFRGLHSGQVSFDAILSKGEQFVIGGALTFGSVSEVLAATIPPKEKNWAISAAMFALSVGLANLLAYVFVPTGDQLIVMTISFGVAALLSSIVCVLMAAGR
ncbi:hypothetical protein [Amycolatopsis sp. NPDC004378]